MNNLLITNDLNIPRLFLSYLSTLKTCSHSLCVNILTVCWFYTVHVHWRMMEAVYDVLGSCIHASWLADRSVATRKVDFFLTFQRKQQSQKYGWTRNAKSMRAINGRVLCETGVRDCFLNAGNPLLNNFKEKVLVDYQVEDCQGEEQSLEQVRWTFHLMCEHFTSTFFVSAYSLIHCKTVLLPVHRVCWNTWNLLFLS